MLTSKKKGQISVEALIIVGVLVIGGIIFASVFLGNINNQTKKANELSGITDDFMNDLEGWGTSTGTGSTPNHCGINGCQIDLGEDNGNCSDCKCGDGFCLSPWEQAGSNDISPNCKSDCGSSALNFSDLQLELIPLGSTNVGNSFGIKVTVDSGYDSANVGKLQIFESGTPTDKCSYNGTYANTFTNLGRLNPTIPRGQVNNIFNFICNTAGTYTFEFSEITPNGLTAPTLSGIIAKTITPAATGCATPGVCGPTDTCPTCPKCCTIPGTSFGVLISSPTDQKYYNNTDNINFIAITAPELKPGETDSCVWYVNEKIEIPLTGQTNSCSLSQVSLSDTSVFSEGLNKITVYAQRSTTAGKKLEANASVGIYILKPINPGTLYLLTPRNLLVGENFNLMVYGTNQGSVTATRNINNFTFTGNKCAVTSSTPSCGTTTVNGTDVYYCDYPAICSQPAYSQTGAHLPVEITASMTGTTETAKFYSEYDLWFDFGNCSVIATSYGKMHACLSSSSGMGYNSDYWNNSSGLLKANVDVSFNMTKNINGTLKVYVE